MTSATTNALSNVIETYRGSDGERTRALYAALGNRGPAGVVALNLFRAAKCSERAKMYQKGRRLGRQYAREAYERKDWSISNLAKALTEFAPALKIVWGWGYDARAIAFEHVLYIELPALGQVSFHTSKRLKGPDYTLGFDGAQGHSSARICKFAANVLTVPSYGQGRQQDRRADEGHQEQGDGGLREGNEHAQRDAHQG